MDLKQWPLSKCSFPFFCVRRNISIIKKSIVMGSNGDFYHHIRYHTFPIVPSYLPLNGYNIPKIKSISHKDSPFATTFDTLQISRFTASLKQKVLRKFFLRRNNISYSYKITPKDKDKILESNSPFYNPFQFYNLSRAIKILRET